MDRTWNKDNGDGFDSIPPFLQYPGTKGGVSDTANGNGGTVYAVAVQPDGKTIIAGSFNSYDSNPYNRIVRLLANGYQDPTFLAAPNSGANDVITCMALQADGKIVIGGNFTSFNGINRYHIARLNSDGTVDTSFNPGTGADGTVWAVSVRADGKIAIGGDFTHYNNHAASYAARLNSDGSLDSTYKVGNSINGPVYSIAIGGASTLNISNNTAGGQAEQVDQYTLGAGNSGSITVTYDMLSIPDDMKIYYGDINGVLVYDTGSVSGTNTFTVTFGPTNGVDTNVITIVMNQGNGSFGTFWSYSAKLTSFGDNAIYIGGLFNSIGGVTAGGVARLTEDGKLDSDFVPGLGSYNPDTGFYDPVYALALQGNKLLVGGSFGRFELADYNGLCRLNNDGSIDTTFNPGTDSQNGTYNPETDQVDSIYAIKIQPDGKILIGGDFQMFNQTRRVGLARLFSYGSVDTSFLDTAYNQFAGLINHYHNPDALNDFDYPQGNHRNYVNAIGVEPGSPNNVIIGGSFLRIGGGSFSHSGNNMPADNFWDNARMDTHPRSNVARLIGGATPGPGNITLTYSAYSASKSAGTMYVSMARTNGSLGVISAHVEPQYGTPGPGIATASDVTGGSDPEWPTLYSMSFNNSWPTAPGTTGQNFLFNSTYSGLRPPDPNVYLNILYNTNITGNVNAKIALNAPDGSTFTLGGEYIPLGAALGVQTLSSLVIIDSNIKPGTFGFSAPIYTVNQGSSATITVTRTGGSDGTVQITYAVTNGTATSPANFTATTNTLTFGPGVLSRTFTVATTTGTTTNTDRTVNLRLFGATAGAGISQTNAVLTIINNTFANGHLAFTTASFATNENAGAALISVNRLGGSSGTLDATVIIGSPGTAAPGVNFTPSTNTLHWNNNDVAVKMIVTPIFQDFAITPNLTVNLSLTNGKANNVAQSKVLGLSAITNSTLTISNIDFAGAVKFPSVSLATKKSAGRALIPVIRTGGSAGSLTVSNFTYDITAVAGVNYTNTAGQLSFAAGEVAKYFSVPIIDDGSGSGLLTLGLALTNASPTGSITSPSNAVLNIIDTATVNEPPGTADNTFDPFAGCNGNVYALALQANNQLIVAGDFSMANQVPRRRIARLNSNGSLDTEFLSPSTTQGADNQIRSVCVQADGRIVIGGFFTNFNQVAQNRLARLNYDGSLDSLFNIASGADNSVYALAQSPVDQKIIVGGAFASLGGVTFGGVGRLNTDGTPDATFNPGGLGAGSVGSSSAVYAVAIQPDGRILIGGDFITYNGTTVNHLARLNADGSLDSTFTVAGGTGANDSVRAIAVQPDGKILIGGLFTNFNGTVLNRIARLNANGSRDTSFNPGVGADDLVSTIALQTDGRILLGGEFTRCNDVTRNRITRLNPDGSVDPTINFGSGASDFVAALVVQQDTIGGYPTNVPDEKIILGGAFTQYNGQPHDHLTRIFGGSVSGSGSFEFSASDYIVAEDGLSAEVTINRTGGTEGNAYAQFFNDIGGTATAGVNFDGFNTNVLFPPGEVQRIISIPVHDDGLITADLTVNLTLVPQAPAAYGNQPTAVLTIQNVDSAISFATSTYQVAKNTVNGVATINLARVGSVNGSSTVHFFTTTNGTAADGVDFSAVVDTVATFDVGQTNVAVTVPIINNPLPTGARTVTMVLSNAIGSLLYAPSNAVLTIIDTVNAPGTLSFLNNSPVVNETDGTAVLTVIRTNGTTGTVSVNYNTTPGTAVVGQNYTAVSGTLTFGDGVTNKIITVPLINNSLAQGATTFKVNLFNAGGGASIAIPTNAVVTINDDEVGIAFALATNTAPEEAGFANITVRRLYNTNGVASAHYTTVDGTALHGVNYTTTTNIITFTNGETIKSLSVPLIRSTNVNGDLRFSLALSAPSGAQLISPSNTVVVIQDADAGLTFTTNSSSVLKNAGYAVITVVCTNTRVEPVVLSTNDIPLAVSYYTVDGTAVAGVDYQAVSGTLIFVNGIGTNQFVVPIYNNGLVNGNHTFNVVLTNATAPGQITPYKTQSVVIIDSNTGLRFSQPNYTIFKNGIAANIDVIRTGYTNSTVAVDFVATNGTAVNGLNFTATNGTLVFTNGQTVRTFTVPIIANSQVQPNLTVLLQLSNAGSSYLVNPSAATLTILENGGSYVLPAGAQLVSETGAGAPNGILDSNETVQVRFAFRDASGLDVTNLNAILLATNGVLSPVAVPVSATNYGPLTVYGHSVSRVFSFTVNGTNALPIAPTFKLYDNAKFIGTAVFGFTVGNWTQSFTNTNIIVIRDNTNAYPYPSTISVSGVGASILKSTVTLNKLTHSYPADVDALVSAPGGTNTLIMANAGSGFVVTNLVLTFDDTATNSLPQSSRLSSGTNRPTQFYPVLQFP